jgi:HNH endonuclease
MQPMLELQCSTCSAILPANHFKPRGKQCRGCRQKRDAARYAANRPEIRLKAAAQYAANPQPAKDRSARRYANKKTEAIAKAREWQQNNRDKVSIRNAKWKKANPEKIRKSTRLRYQRNPAKDIAKVQRRHALTRTNRTELISIHDIIARDGPRCYICGTKTDPRARYASPIKSHLEHVVPLAQGGSHSRDNLKCACRRCNMLKGAKHSPTLTATMLLGFPLVP